MPDTTAYLFLGLALYFGVFVLYIGSLALRKRNLRKDEELIEQLRSDP